LKISTPLYSIRHARDIFGQQIAGNTRDVINKTPLACLHSFGRITGHFHSSLNFIDFPMTPLQLKHTTTTAAPPQPTTWPIAAPFN
jgi:hypothetical protein